MSERMLPNQAEPNSSEYIDLASISPRLVLYWTAAISGVLSVLSLAGHLFSRARDSDSIAILDVGDEVSFGTWYASMLLVSCAVALYIVGRRSRGLDDGIHRRWFLLSLVFMLLSIDESASMHERAGSALRSLVDAGGWLYYTWVIPGILFAAVVGLGSIRLLRSLPARTRNMMVVAGAVFVGCAGGLEVLAGPEAEEHGTDTLTSILFTAVEEAGEMFALCLFLYALLDLIAPTVIRVRVASASSA